ncbi:MAG: amidase [Pseudomonadota bacterium]
MSTFNRRSLLKGLGLSAAGIAALPHARASKIVGDADLAACGRVMDLDFNQGERAQSLAIIDDQIEALRRLHAYRPANSLAPAETFDPRLPGFKPRRQVNGARVSRAAPAQPGSDEDIAFAPIAWQHGWLREGKLTSRQLTEIYLERIARYAPGLECFVTVTADLARAQADEADKDLKFGRSKSPLHGIPYGLKDLIDTKDIRTSWGATPYKDRVAEADAPIVARLRDAGAVLLGKTTCGALAYGDIWFGGKTRNPFNREEGSSGSSAGSGAAVAAGLASFAIGTETLGSIVSPANRNGVTGLRPTFGRVARTGAMALCWSLDKIGPMCRTAMDTALVLAALNGADEGDPAAIDMPFTYDVALPVKGLKVGYDPAWFAGEEVAATDHAMLAAARAAGLDLVEVALPDLAYGDMRAIVEVEAAAAFEELSLTDRDDMLVWQDDHAWPNIFRTIHYFPAVSMVQMGRLRRQAMAAMARLMHDVDAIIHPNYAANLLLIGNMTGYPTLALRAGFIDQPTRTGFASYIKPADIPAGATLHRVPRAGSLTGHLFDEGRLIAIGAAIERELDVWHERPKLA